MEQYSILGRIGEGAHGIVFKAKHIEVTAAQHGPTSAVGKSITDQSICKNEPVPASEM